MRKITGTRAGLLAATILSLILLLFPFAYFDISGIATFLPGSLQKVSVNGIQLALASGLYFSLLGDCCSFFGFWKVLLTGIQCLAVIAPVILEIVCLFLTIYRQNKGARIAILVMQIVAFALELLLLIVLISITREINDVSVMSVGLGSYLTSIAVFACGILAIVWHLQESNKASVSVEPASAYGGIIGLSGEHEGAVLPLERDEVLTFGRDSAACNVILKGKNISRTHCTVKYDKSRNIYIVTDCSNNGTFVKGGERLVRLQGTELKSGTVICLGSEENSFRLR